MIRRKSEKRIMEWIEDPKSALLVSGARQVGKTYLIRHCLKEKGCNFVEINLIEQPELVPVFEQTNSVDELIINLSTVENFSFENGKTFIFIDEVQEVKDVVTKIKFWVDDGRFHYILSGSLLGVELNNLRSAPVGYLQEERMFPLDFEEFIRNSGVNQDVINYLEDCYRNRREVSEIVHDKMMQHFKRYLIVGGMPAAVAEYLESKDMNKVSYIQQGIINQYKNDFTKYEIKEKRLLITKIYDQISSQLLKQNRRFNYSDIKKGLRFERVESSFLWLTNAGVSIPVYNATQPKVALKQNMKSNLLKLYASDIGLLTYQYGNALRYKIIVDDDKANLGGVYENVVAQELHAHGIEMYFYNSHKQGELDFLIELEQSVVPIEVKSGKDYYVHSALDNVLKNPEYEFKESFILNKFNLSVEGKKVYLPIYMCMFIKDNIQLPILEPISFD